MVVPIYLLLCVPVSAVSADTFQLLGDMTRFGTYGITMVMVFLGPLAHFKTGSLTALWSLVSYVLYTRWFAALSLSTAPYLSAYQSSLSDILQPYNLLDISEGKTVSQNRIRTLGIKTTLFIRNSAELILILTVIIVILTFFSMISKGNSDTCLSTIKEKLQFSLISLSLLFLFEDLLIYSLLQLPDIEFTTIVHAISAILSVIYMLFAVLFTLFLPIITFKHINCVKAGAVQMYSRWGVLVDDMKTDLARYRYMYYSVYVLQRWAAAFFLVFFYTTTRKCSWFVCFPWKSPCSSGCY